ncbi:MAG: P-loop NTPase [Candidatus Aerophobetes bacterium]|nr:P-loop NTPase [Candidatus Aerophobetes bacterium]
MDPRLNIVEERLKEIKRLIAISGGKGGVGKSSVASTLALTLSKLGYKVGLLDLDFWGPSAHIILGIEGVFPKEEKGIIPPEIYGIKFISIIYYAGDEPSPLRGVDISNAIIELLTITRWGQLDFLIVDMPPGIGDATLDVIRLMKKVEFLIVTTQSKVTLETVKKVLGMLKELKLPILGIIENMKITNSSFVKDQLKIFDVPFLGEIDFDKNLEDSTGDMDKLLKTNFAQALKKIILKIPEFNLDLTI